MLAADWRSRSKAWDKWRGLPRIDTLSSVENPALISRKHLVCTITTHRILSLGATSFAPGKFHDSTSHLHRDGDSDETRLNNLTHNSIDCFRSRLPLRNSRGPEKGKQISNGLRAVPLLDRHGTVIEPVIGAVRTGNVWFGCWSDNTGLLSGRLERRCWLHLSALAPYSWCLHGLGIVTVTNDVGFTDAQLSIVR